MQYYEKAFIIVLSLTLFMTSQCYYSKHYKKCRINKNTINLNALPLEQLSIQKVTKFHSKNHIEVEPNPNLPLKYEDFDYFYHQFIGAGGSGEVYLVEDQHTSEGKIVKRFFKEKPQDFMRENYIMHKLQYATNWAKDCGKNKCKVQKSVEKGEGQRQQQSIEQRQQQSIEKRQEQSIGQRQYKFSTMAIYPYKQSIVLRKLQFDEEEAALIFYKTLSELEKTHRNGIIHNDLKLGNILVNSIGINFKFYQIQLIDWNLATFYYQAYDSNQKRGTVCYYSPEQEFRTYHLTPATDIWALGVVMFSFFTELKPFTKNCKKGNLQAIITLTGGISILQMFHKYKFASNQFINILYDIKKYPKKYSAANFHSLIPQNRKHVFTEDLIEVFKKMLHPDPQYRSTAAQLMNLPYFNELKILPKMYEQKNLSKKGKTAKSNSVDQSKQK